MQHEKEYFEQNYGVDNIADANIEYMKAEQEKIIEGNKLISEFMGWIKHEDEQYHEHEMKGLKYHSSWDSLMPACRKWDNLTDISRSNYNHYEYLSNCLDSDVSCYEIEPVWDRLVKNITWYNQTQLK